MFEMVNEKNALYIRETAAVRKETFRINSLSFVIIS